MTLSILGGILLNLGAYFTMKGKIYSSVIIYLLADICWLIIAVSQEDAWGVVLIAIGTFLGAVALYKMYKGDMNKSL